jgi:outer membrane immunogenic protein
MYRFILASVAAASMGFSAYAEPVRAPTYAPPSPSWTGFYVGANAGWGWSSFDTRFVPDPTGAFIAVGDLAGPTSFNTRANGGVFGDFDAASISGTQNSIGGSPNNPGLPVTNGISSTEKIDWLASIRARIGFLWGPGLAYFTGGGAWEGVRRDQAVNVFGDTAFSNFSSTRSGFVIGGGYEWQVAQQWTVRGEYLFYDFAGSTTGNLTLPDCNLNTPGACNVALTTGKNNISAVRIGINYKFY